MNKFRKLVLVMNKFRKLVLVIITTFTLIIINFLSCAEVNQAKENTLQLMNEY